jgi:WhiB family redox-sensing transcriptional regulator
MEQIGLESWRDDARCKGAPPDIFFSSEKEEIQAAKDFCRDCPVKDACLEASLSINEGSGIWGGTTEIDRRNIIRKRNRIGKIATHQRFRDISA